MRPTVVVLGTVLLAVAALAGCSSDKGSVLPSTADPSSPAAASDSSSTDSTSPASSAPAPSAPAPSASGEPIAVRDMTPSTDTLTVTGSKAVDLFSVSVPVQSDSERRVVRAVITPAEASDRLYVGQQIVCTGPSKQEITGIQTGRNVVPDQQDQRVTAQFVFEPDEVGEWTCVSKVRVCVPGECSSDSGQGKVTLAVSDNVSERPTRMVVSRPLPDWTQELRAGDDDVVVQSGGTGTMSTTVEDIPLDQGRVQFIGTISLTNCIEATYPEACQDVKKRGQQADSQIVPTFTFTQQGGDGCAVVKATDQQGAYAQDISWKQHHGTYWFLVPNITLNPDCEGTVKVDLSFEVKEGNGIVVERGTADKPTSVVGLVPSNPDLA